ncbi:glycosyltransferase [Cyanobacterium aponinum UTEX 3221]|uniref:glycosyltransferase family 2 protein n=1 Tax=Cyanobacterium aponinum TaxID=379064 RepID=UPI002B4C150E|nr:glycosyltransferase [Cyanobacterium aponinum]WRL37078.1 glycosyltransferase [Cyanobacterium aponinum UTEX 3221]
MLQPSQILQQNSLKNKLKPQTATLVLVSIILLSAIIVALWATGNGEIATIFTYFNSLQENPPMWLETPMIMGKFLLTPTIVMFLSVWLITLISPQPRFWSRTVVILILWGLLIRYLLWRSLSSLNLSDPLSGTFSLLLFFLELLVLFSSSLQLLLMLRVKNRRREADLAQESAIAHQFKPTVDILIPTYDESIEILRRTLIGCQAIDYELKTIYLLDDTKRPEIAKLAQELGCEYRTRPNNLYAKAGNLNYAIPQTTGEFIVVFDADFIPTRNFLQRTLGFFQDSQVALVQTPQNFYNLDPIARNLGLGNVLTPEEEVFYRQIEPIKDGAGSVVCSGTSFVVRRRALEEIGGFVTDSLSEDYFTGVRLSAQGYRLIYLDEKLSAGLAAENISAHATQRLRWARGTLQAFFIDSNPLTIKGLSWLQRLAHLEGLLHWFTSISQVVFLMMPLAYGFLNVIPIRADVSDFLYFFLPYYITQITVFSWLNHHSRSAILSNVYGLVLAFPLAITVIQVMLNPFSKGFKVTPKGTIQNKYHFNWGLAFPLLILFILNAVSLWLNLCICIIAEVNTPADLLYQYQGINLSWIWGIYNLIVLGVALLILIDVPNHSLYHWFQLRRVVKLTLESGQVFWGVTNNISEVGVEVALTQKEFPRISRGDALPLKIELQEESINLTGMVIHTEFDGEFPLVQICFEKMTLTQLRQLIILLYCRPGQWQSKKTPGEFQSIGLLLKTLIKPKFIFEREPKTNSLIVSQI